MENIAHKKEAVAEPERALFFELELLAVSGWSFLYESLKEILAKYDVKMTVPLFSRYFATKSPEIGLRTLAADLEKPQLAEPEVAEAVRAGYVAGIRNAAGARDGLEKLMKDLRGHGILLGALTCMDDVVVVELLAKLGLSQDDIHIMKSEHCGRAAPTAQDWLQLAKQMQASTALCTVAAVSSSSCKAALCAGMRCFAVPDRLTDYQDFGGADFVISSIDDEIEELVLKLVEAF